jgi:hypothetical protein
MSKYKLKVTDKSKNREIADLFECIGANPIRFSVSQATHFFMEGNYVGIISDGDDEYFYKQPQKEINYDELKALVILKDGKKDIATHFQTCDIDERYYVVNNDIIYYYSKDNNEWVLSGARLSELEPIKNLKIIEEELSEMELITGTSAITAMFLGKDVEWARRTNPKVWREYKRSTSFSIDCLTEGDILFRLKEETFMIGGVEVPVAVKEPEFGQVYWFIDGYTNTKGYERAKWDNKKFKFPLACWDSEKKVKKVVQALGNLLQPK